MRYLDLLAGRTAHRPDDIAVVGSGRRLTFRQVDERVGRLGQALRGLALRPGDRVALLSANEPEYLEIQAACLRSGFALVPLNIRLTVRELAFILADCAASVLIAGRGQHDRAERLAADGRIPHLLGLGEPARLPGYEPALTASIPEPEADPDDPHLTATILYTSGTTGTPKGAMIDRQAFTARVLTNCAELQLADRDVHMASLPMFHIAAFLAYAHTLVGAGLVMLPEFRPGDALATMAGEGVTTTVLVPTMLSMLLNSPAVDDFDASALRLMIYGGSAMEPGLLCQAMERFDCQMHQQYGMTESGGQTILRPADHDPADLERLSSAGTEAVSFEVRVVDENDRPVAQGEIGEVVCRSPAVMSGYWNRPEATEETLRGGWLHTGDMGYRDRRGYLHIVDRRRDLVITGGENVYPREVETVLLEHPGVVDVAVLGTPDPTWGQVVTAVLVEPAPPEEEVERWARERLAGYKVPRRWVRVAELPRNVTGKVLKHRLRDLLDA